MFQEYELQNSVNLNFATRQPEYGTASRTNCVWLKTLLSSGDLSRLGVAPPVDVLCVKSIKLFLLSYFMIKF